jgi:hypothetical protein
MSGAHALTSPPNSGKFFYMELDKNIDYVTQQSKDDYNYMYHANVFSGSKNTKTELWISS